MALTKFQNAAVNRIVETLTKDGGSGRFLLADEVGLGKTLVAKGVIEELARQRKGGLTVVYICSNVEIVEQNKSKLVEPFEFSNERLTLLPIHSKEIERQRRRGKTLLFSFTPGTSLSVGRGMGVRKERSLLLYLLLKAEVAKNSRVWREYFRGGCTRSDWEEVFMLSHLKRVFEGVEEKYATNFVARLNQMRLPDLEDKRDCLVTENFEKWVCSSAPKQKRLVIGKLRECLATVCLEFIHPHLIIMDEFQRFADIMKNFNDPTKLEHRMIRKEGAKFLILSATPYKMYTPDEEDHYKGFYETLTFLFNSKLDSPKISAIRSKLENFRKQLTSGEANENRESSLRELKSGIEADLKEVMCRTERYWYIEETNKGILEVPSGGEAQKRMTPRVIELREYVQLRKFLLKDLSGHHGSCATDFWKSCPSILSFMDSGYKFIKTITDLKIPESLLLRRKQLEKTFHHNLKLRLFLAKVLHGKVEEPVEYDPASSPKTLWRHLWIPPTYQYYSDAGDFTSGGGPHKFLVFSHWRFVPRALASILSRQIELLIRHHDNKQKGPLKFNEKTSLFPFDVCFPSLCLAREVQPLQLFLENGANLTLKDLTRAAEAKIRKLLDLSGVKIGPESPSTWQVVARLEAQSPHSDQVRESVEQSSVRFEEEEGEFYGRHKEKYLGYLDDTDKTLTVSRAQIRRLARIALFSPANCMLRSALSTLRNEDGSLPIREILLQTVNLGVNELRKYFNRPIVQAVINQVASGNHYNDRVLDYCQKGHYQEMMDEYFYLLARVLQKSKIRSGTKKKQSAEVSSFDHLAGVLGTHAGATSINERAKSGRMDEGVYRQSTHFALPFGESEAELEEKTKRHRGTSVRDAFNSPFWPFVLITTSRGQEGLDFHLYCRDVVHWNLPSNPVDLEQREGRINRYDGLCIRQNIRRDYQLSDIKWSAGKSPTDAFVPNVWDSLFSNIENDPQFFSHHFKHGLFPHWVYVPRVAADGNIMIRRHLLFYYGSRDLTHYQRLKKDLGLYRLAFGQPRQQDMIDEIRAKMDPKGQSWDSNLEQLMINLSPISKDEIWQDSLVEARKILVDPSKTSQLLTTVRKICQTNADCLKIAWEEIDDCVEYIIKIGTPPPEGHAQKAEEIIAALLYLINPYDSIYDRFPRVGFSDDIEKIKLVHRKTI